MLKTIAGIWYSAIVIAVIISVALYGPNLYLDYISWAQATTYQRIAIPLIFITFVSFWLMILEDFFEHYYGGKKWLVGISLFLLHWLAILAYFWLVVWPRKTPNPELS